MGAFNGLGQFIRSYLWTNDAANDINITASRMDTEDNGFAAGLSNCVTRDGQSPPVAALPMSGFNFTGLGTATTPGQAVEYSQFSDVGPLFSDGHLGLGTPPATDAVLSIETESAAGLQRAISIEHNDPTAGSWAIDLHVNQGGYGAFGVHYYSDRNGDPSGGVAAKLDHTRNGSILALSNARNQVTSPGTTGTADFIVGAGFPDTSVSLATDPIVLFQWTYQNIILTPQNAWPLTITGSGLVINALSTSPRGLEVNQGATTIPAGNFTGVQNGVAIATTGNGGQTLSVVKNGTGNGSLMVLKNQGIDPSIVGLTGVTQGFAVYPNGDFYHGTTKVVGAQGAAVVNAVAAVGPPTQAEFNAFVTQFNTAMNRLRDHGLIAP